MSAGVFVKGRYGGPFLSPTPEIYMKRVRMLVDKTVDGLQYRANQVVDFPNDVAAALTDGDIKEADASQGAVDYCMKELKAEPIVHADAASRAAATAVNTAQNAVDSAQASFDAETDAGRRASLGKMLKTAKDALAAAQAAAKK